MTYDEVKKLLEGIRHYKKLLPLIKAELAEMRSRCEPLLPLPGRASTESAESMFIRYERLQDRLAKHLEGLCDNEERLNEAISRLPPSEKKIVIGYYFRRKSHRKIAYELSYQERNIYYIKRKAIEEIAKCMEQAK